MQQPLSISNENAIGVRVEFQFWRVRNWNLRMKAINRWQPLEWFWKTIISKNFPRWNFPKIKRISFVSFLFCNKKTKLGVLTTETWYQNLNTSLQNKTRSLKNINQPFLVKLKYHLEDHVLKTITESWAKRIRGVRCWRS